MVKRRKKKPKESLIEEQPEISRIPKTDEIPRKKPRWLWTKYTPKNDGQFKVTPDYPKLVDPEALKKLHKKRKKKKTKNNPCK